MLSVMSQPDSSMNFLNFVLSQCGSAGRWPARGIGQAVADCDFAPGRHDVGCFPAGRAHPGSCGHQGIFERRDIFGNRVVQAQQTFFAENQDGGAGNRLGVRIQPVNRILRYRFFSFYIRVSLSFKMDDFTSRATSVTKFGV